MKESHMSQISFIPKDALKVLKSIEVDVGSKSGGHLYLKISSNGQLPKSGPGERVSFDEVTKIFKDIMGSKDFTAIEKIEAIHVYKTIADKYKDEKIGVIDSIFKVERVDQRVVARLDQLLLNNPQAIENLGSKGPKKEGIKKEDIEDLKRDLDTYCNSTRPEERERYREALRKATIIELNLGLEQLLKAPQEIKKLNTTPEKIKQLQTDLKPYFEKAGSYGHYRITVREASNLIKSANENLIKKTLLHETPPSPSAAKHEKHTPVLKEKQSPPASSVKPKEHERATESPKIAASGEKVSSVAFAAETKTFKEKMASEDLTPVQKGEAINTYERITNKYQAKETGFFTNQAKIDKEVRQATDLIESERNNLAAQHLTLIFKLAALDNDKLVPLGIDESKTKELIFDLTKYYLQEGTFTPDDHEDYKKTLNAANFLINHTNDLDSRLIAELQDEMKSVAFNRNLKGAKEFSQKLENYYSKKVFDNIDENELLLCIQDMNIHLAPMDSSIDKAPTADDDDKVTKVFERINILQTHFHDKYPIVSKPEENLRSLEDAANKSKKNSDVGISFGEATEIFKEIMSSNLTPRQKGDALTAYTTITDAKEGKKGFFAKPLSYVEIDEANKLIEKSNPFSEHTKLIFGLEELQEITPQMITKLETTRKEIVVLRQKLTEYYNKEILSPADKINYRYAIDKANVIIKSANDEKKRSAIFFMEQKNNVELKIDPEEFQVNPRKARNQCSALVDKLTEFSNKVFYEKDKTELDVCKEALNVYIRSTLIPVQLQQKTKEDAVAVGNALENFQRYFHEKYLSTSVDKPEKQPVEPKIEQDRTTSVVSNTKQIVEEPNKRKHQGDEIELKVLNPDKAKIMHSERLISIVEVVKRAKALINEKKLPELIDTIKFLTNLKTDTLIENFEGANEKINKCLKLKNLTDIEKKKLTDCQTYLANFFKKLAVSFEEYDKYYESISSDADPLGYPAFSSNFWKEEITKVLESIESLRKYFNEKYPQAAIE